METYTRRSRSPESHNRVVYFQSRLADAGLAPKTTSDAYPSIEMERGMPLSEWLKSATTDDRAIMRARLIALVRGVHAAGVCHRDLHVSNIILVKDGKPLVIDPEHALEVDPRGPCFDICGPKSRVPVAPDHVAQPGPISTTGVWWDADLGQGTITTLGSAFGTWTE